MATFAVVHGGGDTGWAWHLSARALRDRGHAVVAVDLPCEDDSAGWAEYADTVVEAVGDAEDVVVVGHSLGGFTAPLVCERVDARLLVLTAGMVPAPGETANDWWENVRYPAGAGEGDETAIFFHDLEPALAAEALARGRDQSGTPMAEPWPLTSWPDVPTRYVVFRDDRFFPGEWARGMVRDRLGIEADETPGGHCAYLSRPAELAALLDSYVGAWATT